MSTSNTARKELEAERRQKAKAAAVQASAADRRRTLLRRLAVAAGVTAAIVAIVAVGALTGKDPRTGAGGHDMAAMNDHAAHDAAAAAGGQNMPPWPAPANGAALARKAGLEPSGMEGTAEHYHAKLQVVVNGQQVPVASGIGVDNQAQLMSPLHVHEADGTIHVESPDKGRTFTLGQVFLEWDVALSANQIGGLHTDATHPLTLTVNGKTVPGNPADLVLAGEQQIELRYGA